MDSQAALIALEANEVKLKLVWEYRESLMKLTEHNTLLLVRVPGHTGFMAMKEQMNWLKEQQCHPLVQNPVLKYHMDISEV